METDIFPALKLKTVREERKWRGVFEKVPGSGEWWIRYVDASGRYRREKAGTKGVAIDLVRKRKTDALQGKKLPEKLRRRVVRFSELAKVRGKTSRIHPHRRLPRLLREPGMGTRDIQPHPHRTLRYLQAGNRKQEGRMQPGQAAQAAQGVR